MGYFEFIGYGTVVDSLSAIKKLVFEEKKLTMSELLDALQAISRARRTCGTCCMNVPCYGNNDPYADSIAKAVDRAALEFTHKYSKELGVHLDLRLVPFTSHVPFGKVVSATPNGRKAWTPLSDGSSASQGSDKNGPTAVLLSNFTTKNYDYRERAARLLNIKFTPKCVAGEEGTRQAGLLHPHLVRSEAVARSVQHHQQADARCGPARPGKIPGPHRAGSRATAPISWIFPPICRTT